MATFQGTNKTITLSEFLATHKHLQGDDTAQSVRERLRMSKPDKVAMGGNLPLTQRNLRWLKNAGWALLPDHVYIQQLKYWNIKMPDTVATDIATACCVLESDSADGKVAVIDANCNLLRVDRSCLRGIVSYMQGKGFTLSQEVSIVKHKLDYYTILGYKKSSELPEYPTELFLAEGDMLFSEDDGEYRVFSKAELAPFGFIKFLRDADISAKLEKREDAALKAREYAKSQRVRVKTLQNQGVDDIHQLMHDMEFRNGTDAVFIGNDVSWLTLNAFLNHFQFPGQKNEALKTLDRLVGEPKVRLTNPVVPFIFVKQLMSAGWNLKVDSDAYVNTNDPSDGICRIINPQRVYREGAADCEVAILRSVISGSPISICHRDSITPVEDYVRGLGFHPIPSYRIPLKGSRTPVTIIGQVQDPAITSHATTIVYVVLHPHAKFVKYGIGTRNQVELVEPPIK